jgi:hypothetical protein
VGYGLIFYKFLGIQLQAQQLNVRDESNCVFRPKKSPIPIQKSQPFRSNVVTRRGYRLLGRAPAKPRQLPVAEHDENDPISP